MCWNDRGFRELYETAIPDALLRIANEVLERAEQAIRPLDGEVDDRNLSMRPDTRKGKSSNAEGTSKNYKGTTTVPWQS